MSRPIIGVSENIVKIREVINHIADTGLNTVICGESGVGKEVVDHREVRGPAVFAISTILLTSSVS